MKRLGFWLTVLLFLAGCVTKPPVESAPTTETVTPVPFSTEVLYELHEDVPDEYRVDIVLPQVAPGVAGGERINKRIREHFTWLLTKGETPWRAEGESYVWTQISYHISNQGGICSLNIIERFSSLNRPEAEESFFAYCYYYDENKGRVIPTPEEYLKRLGVTEADLLSLLREQYGDRYDAVEPELGDFLYRVYFDESGTAVFNTQNLDYKLGNLNAPPGNADGVELRLGKSTLFTRAELEAAAACVTEWFLRLEDCTLLWLEYDEAHADEDYEGYMAYGGGLRNGVARENVVHFNSHFEIGQFAEVSVLESGGHWGWTVVRDDADGPWRLEDHGY